MKHGLTEDRKSACVAQCWLEVAVVSQTENSMDKLCDILVLYLNTTTCSLTPWFKLLKIIQSSEKIDLIQSVNSDKK